jgi:hypothetical protein
MKKRLAGLYQSQSIASGSMLAMMSPKRITDGTSEQAIEVAMNKYLNGTGAGDYDLP